MVTDLQAVPYVRRRPCQFKLSTMLRFITRKEAIAASRRSFWPARSYSVLSDSTLSFLCLKTTFISSTSTFMGTDEAGFACR